MCDQGGGVCVVVAGQWVGSGDCLTLDFQWWASGAFGVVVLCSGAPLGDTDIAGGLGMESPVWWCWLGCTT